MPTTITDLKIITPQIEDANNNEVLKFVSTASAVNEVTVTNAATAGDPKMEATGGDTNIGLNLVSKGTGLIKANGAEIYSSGGTDVPITDGGTGASTASGARTNLSAAISGANSDITSMTGVTGAIKAPTQVQDTNSNEVIIFGSVASAVNEVTLTNAATGNSPKLEATGGDVNIGLNILGKGTGQIGLQSEIVITEAKNIILGSTTGTKIGTATTQKLGFYNSTPVIKPAALTGIDATTVDATYGTEESGVINNLRTRLNELETKLQNLGLLS